MITYNLRPSRIPFTFSFLGILLACLLITTYCSTEGIERIVAMFVYAFTFLLVFVIIWITHPVIELTPDGIRVQLFVRKRFYPWSDIQQAGILHRPGGSRKYNELVLLKPGGSPRKFNDKRFERRNTGRIIYMELTPEIQDYVIKYYGPLDFDLSDGRSEQSIVIDN